MFLTVPFAHLWADSVSQNPLLCIPSLSRETCFIDPREPFASLLWDPWSFISLPTQIKPMSPWSLNFLSRVLCRKLARRKYWRKPIISKLFKWSNCRSRDGDQEKLSHLEWELQKCIVCKQPESGRKKLLTWTRSSLKVSSPRVWPCHIHPRKDGELCRPAR